MPLRITRMAIFLIGLILLSVPAAAATIAACDSTFTTCLIPENTSLQLPFTGFAGDVILLEPNGTTVSDVFRIFNNILNTGRGTGFGNTAFLYSADDIALPNPSSYSANAVFLMESPSGTTSYLGNGTTYVLGAPEPRTFGSLGLACIALAVLARRRSKGRLGRPGMRTSQLAMAATLALCSRVAFAQVVNIDQPVVNLVDGPVNVVAKFDLPIGTGPATYQLGVAAPSAGLAFYTASYLAFGTFPLPFHIVGTDPSLGANTTTIPTVLVPLKFIFPNAGNPTLDGTNVIAATLNSPIFQAADYKAGSVDLGTTQYGDALQRGEFWNLPGFSPNYHVLLGTPSIAATVTVTVPAGKGNAFALSGGGFMGVLDTTYFEQLLATLTPSYTANQLPIFTTDNVYLGANGLIQNCCILGFHASQGGPIATAKTWIYAAYAEPGTLSGFVDVVPLSHEVAEWLNDPFVGDGISGVNWIPPAVLPGQGGACIPNFETGDPLESYTFAKVTNGTTYHLQDEVFLPWYLQSPPSFSVNGWNTFQNLSAQVPLVVNSPSGIAGSYTNTATLAWAPVNTPVTGDVVYVGRGCPGDTYLANPSGKIALIDRGTCAVSLKVDAAATAGAVGVLIGLVAPGDAISFFYGGGSTFVPSLVITQAISNAIKNALTSSPVNATISPNNAIPTPGAALCGPG